MERRELVGQLADVGGVVGAEEQFEADQSQVAILEGTWRFTPSSFRPDRIGVRLHEDGTVALASWGADP